MHYLSFAEMLLNLPKTLNVANSPITIQCMFPSPFHKSTTIDVYAFLVCNYISISSNIMEAPDFCPKKIGLHHHQFSPMTIRSIPMFISIACMTMHVISHHPIDSQSVLKLFLERLAIVHRIKLFVKRKYTDQC